MGVLNRAFCRYFQCHLSCHQQFVWYPGYHGYQFCGPLVTGAGGLSTPSNLRNLLKSEAKCSETLSKSVEIENHNFRLRYTNGNKPKNGIRILHWNPGAKHLRNKVQNIESVVCKYKPEILGISESNFYQSHDVNDVQLENYNLFFSETINNQILKSAEL